MWATETVFSRGLSVFECGEKYNSSCVIAVVLTFLQRAYIDDKSHFVFFRMQVGERFGL